LPSTSASDRLHPPPQSWGLYTVRAVGVFRPQPYSPRRGGQWASPCPGLVGLWRGPQLATVPTCGGPHGMAPTGFTRKKSARVARMASGGPHGMAHRFSRRAATPLPRSVRSSLAAFVLTKGTIESPRGFLCSGFLWDCPLANIAPEKTSPSYSNPKSHLPPDPVVSRNARA